MKTTLRIDGMSCEHCVAHVKNALEAVQGVKSADVSLNDKSAAIEHEDDVSLALLKTAVTEEGYEVLA
jgi:copper ion binding protein